MKAERSDYFYLSPNWEEATRLLPRDAHGLLKELAGFAAANNSTTLAVDYDFLESLRDDPTARIHVHWSFELLLRRQFIREVTEGRYLIAPGLWALATDLDTTEPTRRTAD